MVPKQHYVQLALQDKERYAQELLANPVDATAAAAADAIDNDASNGVARSAGFTLLRQLEIEYPPGHTMQANEWVFDLR